MPAQVKYQKYQMLAPNGEALFEADLTQPVNVKQEYLHQFLVDLHSFTIDPQLNSNLKTRLAFSWDNNQLEVRKDYHSKAVDILPPDLLDVEAIKTWRDEYIHAPIADTKVLVKQIEDSYKKLASQPKAQSQVETVLSDKEKEFIAQGGDAAQKYLDLSKKLKVLDDELNLQRSKDEATLASGEIESMTKAVEDQISAVGWLVNKHQQIKAELAKFHKLLTPDLEQQTKALKQEVKGFREQELKNTTTSVKGNVLSSNSEEDTPGKPFMAKFILVFPAILFVLGLIGYLTKHNYVIVFLAVLGSLIEFGFLAGLNAITPEIDISELTPNLRKAVEANVPAAGSGRQRLAQLEKFFLDKAWAQALVEEEQNFQKLIKSRLGDADLTELQNTRLVLQAQLDELKSLTGGEEAADIPPQEYLHKRRELDMLRIDKSRAEADLRDLANFAQIAEFMDDMNDRAEAVVEIEIDLEGVVDKFTKLRLHENHVELFSLETNAWQAQQLQISELTAIWVLLRFNLWQQERSKPFILANILTKVSDTAKLVLENKLSAARGNGQIVLVQTIA